MKSIMFTFESIYTKKIGGLSEVPPRLGEALLSLGINVEIYTPGHSAIDACREPVFKTRIDNVEYCIAKIDVKPVHYVVGGGILDDPVVYSLHGLQEKAFVFGRVLYEYFSRMHFETPIVFHGHDWHSIPALLAISKLVAEKNHKAGIVLHFHLGTRNIIDKELIVKHLDIRDDTLIRGALGSRKFRDYYERSNGLFERLGALLADKIITVSKGYMKRLSRIIGLDNSVRLSYVFNATPFTWEEASRVIRIHHGIERPEEISVRLATRRELLTRRLRDISLRQVDQGTERLVERILREYDTVYNKPFRRDGPLVFMVGRLSKQKGFDLVARVLDRMIMEEPDVRLILAGIPSQWDESLVKYWVELAVSYEDNLRFLPGVLSKEDLILIYYASNLTLIPSRTEPFGLVALESMATGTPVAASRVDGLADIVVDVRNDHLRGNGVLFDYMDLMDLVEASIYLLRLVERSYRDTTLQRIRENAMIGSMNYRWVESAARARDIYSGLLH